MDILEELEKEGDSILHEVTIIETEKGRMLIILPENSEEPENVEQVGTLLCQLILGYLFRLKDRLEIMQSALTEKDRRVIPVSIMPSNIKL